MARDLGFRELPKDFVVMAITVDSFDADIRAQVNGITDATIRPAQSNLEGYFAISEKDARKARARVGKGQLGRP